MRVPQQRDTFANTVQDFYFNAHYLLNLRLLDEDEALLNYITVKLLNTGLC